MTVVPKVTTDVANRRAPIEYDGQVGSLSNGLVDELIRSLQPTRHNRPVDLAKQAARRRARPRHRGQAEVTVIAKAFPLDEPAVINEEAECALGSSLPRHRKKEGVAVVGVDGFLLACHIELD